jgi:hypothetical protein
MKVLHIPFFALVSSFFVPNFASAALPKSLEIPSSARVCFVDVIIDRENSRIMYGCNNSPGERKCIKVVSDGKVAPNWLKINLFTVDEFLNAGFKLASHVSGGFSHKEYIFIKESFRDGEPPNYQNISGNDKWNSSSGWSNRFKTIRMKWPWTAPRQDRS